MSGGPTLVNKALVLALKDHLNEHCRLIAVLEAQVRFSSSEPFFLYFLFFFYFFYFFFILMLKRVFCISLAFYYIAIDALSVMKIV